jgi:hypothetical protein
MTRSLRTYCAVLLLTVLLVPTAHPQESLTTGPDSASGSRAGVIAGHAFIPSTFIRDPFVRTFLQTGLGFGSTLNYAPPPVTVKGRTLSGSKGDLLFAIGLFEYQYALRPWLGVRARLEMTGRLADETSTLVAQGVTLFYGFDLGWLVKLVSGERFFVSGSLGVKNTSTTDVYIQRFIEGIIDSGKIVPGNKLVMATPALRGSAGVQGAYVLSRLTGVTIAGTLDYGESMDRGEPDKWYYSLSMAFDFNLRSHNGVPLGFIVGGKTGTGPDLQGTDERSSQTIFGRIAYTGAEQFALGLDVGYQFIPIRNLEEKQNFLSATLDIRLYF